MLNTPTFTCLAKQEQWLGTTDINLTFVVGHDGFPNLYVFAIGELGLIQVGIHQVSYQHARNLIGSTWFMRVLPRWLQRRIEEEQGFHWEYIGRFPDTVTFSRCSKHDIHVTPMNQVQQYSTNTL